MRSLNMLRAGRRGAVLPYRCWRSPAAAQPRGQAARRHVLTQGGAGGSTGIIIGTSVVVVDAKTTADSARRCRRNQLRRSRSRT